MFSIGVFGISGVGKRKCLSKLAATVFQDAYRSNIGVEFYAMSRFIDNTSVKLDLWVFRWEERFKHLILSYCELKEGFVFMVDVTKNSSLAYIDEWLEVCRGVSDSGEEVPIVLLGNKADLPRQREVSREQAVEIVKSRGLSEYFEVSCKTGYNIEEAFDVFSRMLVKKHRFDKISL